MKKMLLNTDDEGIPSAAIREISLLKELSDHPNIVKYVKILDDSIYYRVFFWIKRKTRVSIEK
jgi:hypothetical protein